MILTDTSVVIAAKASSSREFETRDSLLTCSGGALLYNIGVVSVGMFLGSCVIQELMAPGTLHDGFDILMTNLTSLPVAVLFWSAMQATTFLVYSMLHTWNNTSHSSVKIVLCVLGVIGLVLFLLVPPALVMWLHLPALTTLVLLEEQVRFCMKIWSFVVEKKGSSELSFKNYVFFLFAPTLLYRDDYPRSAKRCWRTAAKHFCESVALLLAIVLFTKLHLITNIEVLIQTKVSLLHIVGIISSTAFPWLILSVGCIFLILHCWQNFFAELLRFGDRQFYLDWWHAKDHREFCRTWNRVIHVWLVEYILKSLGKIRLFHFWKNFPIYGVFFISALVHDYIEAFAFGYFFPGYLFTFGLLTAWFTLYLPRIGNMVVIFSTALWGPGVLYQFFALEYFTRQNCPSALNSTLLDQVVPRILYCYPLL